MQPIKRLLIALLLAVAICQLSFVVFTKEVEKYEVHNTERLRELLLDHTYYDLIFLGSSRTHFGINPKVIDSICRLASYNAGIEGGNLYEFEMMLKSYLENHPPPRYIALNLDLHSFSKTPGIFNYPVYFPYTSNKVINAYMSDNGYLNSTKRIFPFLKLADYDDDTKGAFLKRLAGKTEITQGDFQYKGYISNTDVTIKNDARMGKHYLEITNDKRQMLDRIIQLCRQKHIELIFTYSPEYKREYEQSVTNCDEIFATVDSFATSNHIRFIRDDRLEINNNPLVFANVNHLNRNGAQEYSIILAKELQTNLGLPK